MDIQSLIKQEGVKIIDVREKYEFETGHLPGAVNMPLSVFNNYIDEVMEVSEPQIFYCRSGNRSGQAVEFLKTKFQKEHIYNGGSLSILESFLVSH